MRRMQFVIWRLRNLQQFRIPESFCSYAFFSSVPRDTPLDYMTHSLSMLGVAAVVCIAGFKFKVVFLQTGCQTRPQSLVLLLFNPQLGERSSSFAQAIFEKLNTMNSTGINIVTPIPIADLITTMLCSHARALVRYCIIFNFHVYNYLLIYVYKRC